MDSFEKTYKFPLAYCKSSYEVAEGCDALMLVTEWNEFRQLDLPRLKELMHRPVFIDCRNVYKPERMFDAGFRYRSFGRGVERQQEKETK